jgi:hypothetical protein
MNLENQYNKYLTKFLLKLDNLASLEKESTFVKYIKQTAFAEGFNRIKNMELNTFVEYCKKWGKTAESDGIIDKCYFTLLGSNGKNLFIVKLEAGSETLEIPFIIENKND